MTAIGIVDDNKKQREALAIRLKLLLRRKGSSLEIKESFPLKDKFDYFNWMEQNDIVLLILDERLNESQHESEPVDYRANELVSLIRERYKELPIFAVTSWANDEDLQEKFGEFDYIISRNDFNDKDDFVDIMLRSCQRYLDQNEKELSEFEILTRKVASGNGVEQDMERLNALQVKLNIPMVKELSTREEWLEEYENQIKVLEAIQAKIQKKLSDK